jgi:hypothetical protein
MGELTSIIINDVFKNYLDIDDIEENIIKSQYIDFIKMIFYESQLLSEDLTNSLNE